MRNPKNRVFSAHWTRLITLTTLVWAATALGGCTDDPETEINQAPVLTLDVGSQESYVIGEVIQIRASADDPDGDPLSFSVDELPERAELQTFPNSAQMTWDPISSDVTEGGVRKIVFVVEDDRGGRSERVVNLTILAGNGTPAFVSPSSKLFDPSGGQALTIDVEVRDDDSSDVELTMPAETAPEGANFEQIEQKTGRFTWTPASDQLDQRVHTVTFVANDHQGDPVTQKVTIILQSSDPDNPGPGDGPTPSPGSTCDEEQLITHAAPSAQRGVEDYELVAYLSEAGTQKYDEGIVFWTTTNPMKYDVDLNSIEMKVDPGRMRAGIPNLLLNEGESETIYYTICAVDSTADVDDDDAFVCAPVSYYYSFNAYSPDSNICFDDAASGESFAEATEVSPVAWENYLTCENASDFHKVSVEAGGLAEIYITYSLTEDPDAQTPHHPMEVTVYDEAQNPQPDLATVSECSGIAYIALEAPESAPQTWYIEVAPDGDDEMPYQMTAFHTEPEEPVDTCEDDDEFGPDNRSPEDAPLIEAGEYNGLVVCGGENEDQADWYTNILGVDDVVYLVLTVEEGADLEDIFLGVYNSSGGLKGVAEQSGNTLELLYEATEEDFYYYIVEAPAETHYSLDVLTE